MAFRYKKNQRLTMQAEFRKADARLQFIALTIMGFVEHTFSKDLVITEIFRTPAQQRFYYKQPITGPYKRSVHEFGRGIDFGIRYYRPDDLDSYPYDHPTGNPALTKPETQTIDEWFSKVVLYDDERPKFDSLVHHDVGLGDHLHLQVSWKKTTRITSDVSQVRLLMKRYGVTL